jgi:hypothetical protein
MGERKARIEDSGWKMAQVALRAILYLRSSILAISSQVFALFAPSRLPTRTDLRRISELVVKPILRLLQ